MMVVKYLTLAATLLLVFACKRADPVPQNTQMWRVDGEWKVDDNNDIKIAPASIITFRGSKEFVEVHTWVLERKDATVYILPRAPRTVAVGKWEQRGSKVNVERKKVVGLPCERITFQVSGDSVTDNAGSYSPVTNLVAPEFETFVNAAKKTGTACGEP